MLYSLYKFGYFLAGVVPIKAAYSIANTAAFIYFHLFRKGRCQLEENLKVILGESATEREVKGHSLEVYKNFAKYLADFFKFSRFQDEYLEKTEVVGRHKVDEALSQGKGAIFVAIHLGNWELGGAAMGALGYPMNAIALDHKDPRVTDFFTGRRSSSGVNSISIGISLKECFRCLKRNELLAIVGDKDYTNNGVSCTFFGRKAVVPKGAAVFSLKTGSPILFAVTVREKDDTFKLFFEGPINYNATGDMEKDVDGLISEYLKLFEKYIKMYPDQWYAFSKIWVQD